MDEGHRAPSGIANSLAQAVAGPSGLDTVDRLPVPFVHRTENTCSEVEPPEKKQRLQDTPSTMSDASGVQVVTSIEYAYTESGVVIDVESDVVGVGGPAWKRRKGQPQVPPLHDG